MSVVVYSRTDVKLNPSWDNPKIHQGNPQVNAGKKKCLQVSTTVRCGQIEKKIND